MRGLSAARGPAAQRSARRSLVVRAAAADADPLMVRAARGEKVERAPCWMMRQAGRYQKCYRDLALKYPSFRQRSETTDLIVEISLQPWNSFKPDGVILFSDILTPLPAIGIDFEIDDAKGPILERTYRSAADVASLHELDVDRLPFIGESLSALRAEVGPKGAAVLGFVGSPWTLATYAVEGASSSTYKTIKSMAFSAPDVLAALLTKLAAAIADYAVHQAKSGAHAIQLFDSWGGQLPPHMWEKWSAPYLRTIIDAVHERAPGVPVTLYANGSGGLIERLGQTGADVIGLDWSVDMADGRRRLGPNQPVQGNVDPVVLFAGEAAIEDAVRRVLAAAGPTGHVLNLGHGVLVGTPEEAVGHMFALSKSVKAAAVV